MPQLLTAVTGGACGGAIARAKDTTPNPKNSTTTREWVIIDWYLIGLESFI
jgi:hypothetical protein